MDLPVRRKPKSESFDASQYATISLADLVLYALFSLRSKGLEGTFENLAAESYELFPLRFSLQGYPEYPDSCRVDREIRRMYGALGKEGVKGFVKGSLKTRFELTEGGLDRIQELQKRMKADSGEVRESGRMMSDKRGKIGRIINHVQGHALYKRYVDGRLVEVPEHLLRDLLLATMETSQESLNEKMEILMGYCDDAGKSDLKEFLRFCSKKHPDIFPRT
jgi:hypothetical protein